MSRSADYTIKGFLYQFNKTLLEIFKSTDDGIVTAEGIIEDVDIATPAGITAIQCKYHEASESFTPSTIYKPLLQMMYHFLSNPDANIQYILFAHFPGVLSGAEPVIDINTFNDALSSRNKDLQPLIALLGGKIDIDKFSQKFTMEFGPNFDDLVRQVTDALLAKGIPKDDIETLAYPNAINLMAGYCIKHDPEDRKITPSQFLETLKAIRQTAISRWTMALRTRKQLLDARRKQLKPHLDKNTRLRYFIVDSSRIADYDNEIVLFVSDYLDKYHIKPAHISTPLLCISTSEDDFSKVQYRLFQKGIISTDGYIGAHFDESRLFRDPLICKEGRSSLKREFSLRLVRWEVNKEVLNKRKCDDLFVIGEPDCSCINTSDINVENLPVTSLKEIKYVLGVSNDYE